MEEELRACVRVLLALERVEHHPEDREEEGEPHDPGEQPERGVHPTALADHPWRRNRAHATYSPFSSPERSRSDSVAMMLESKTTIMLYENSSTDPQPPPI